MAVPGLTFGVSGLRESEQAILDLANEYGPRNARNALGPAMRTAMRPVRDAVENTTPIDTGELRSLTNTRSGQPSRFDLRDRGDLVFVVRTGWFWNTTNSHWFQALAVEFGTSQQVGRRVLRRALNNNIRSVIAIFSDNIGSSIERTAARLARRRLRQGAAFRRR